MCSVLPSWSLPACLVWLRLHGTILVQRCFWKGQCSPEGSQPVARWNVSRCYSTVSMKGGAGNLIAGKVCATATETASDGDSDRIGPTGKANRRKYRRGERGPWAKW